MAVEVKRTRTDDLDGSEAAETVTFTYEGRAYELDLSAENAAAYHAAMAPFVRAARRARYRDQHRRQGHATHQERSAEIRAWAKQRGIKVNRMGRIPAGVIKQFEEAHAS